MAIPLSSIPSFTAAEAQAFAQREYGIAGSAARLPSERDQNFLIAADGGAKFVLKIGNSNDASDLLDLQNQAMRHVEKSQTECRVQQVLASHRGRDIETIHHDKTGADHCVRVLTWIEGEVLALATSRGAGLFESIGAGLAKIDRALCDFSHPAMHRVLQWDLRRALMAREHIVLLPPHRRAQIERHFAQWKRIDWAVLRYSVIHGDANDYNVIVADGRMVGLLDFGDMVFTATVCELAIALAYVMFAEKDPLAAAAQVLRAYQRCYPLTGAERRVLFTLVLCRLSMSVCYSAHNRARNPTDPYQVVSETAAWDLIDTLERCLPEDGLTFLLQ